MDFVYTALLFLVLLASVAFGWAAQHRLQERRIPNETAQSIRLLMGMLVTFAALVLGLLTSSAKQRFDAYDNDLSAYSARLIELDHRLRLYGPDAADIRALLRRYTAAAIADTWPDETLPAGQYPRFRHVGDTPPSIEGTALGTMLADADMEIEHLAPHDPYHDQIAMRLRSLAAAVIQQRWHLILSARSTISWPLLAVLTTWLAIIFAIFGLTSPRSRLIYTVVMLAALSIASPLYLILDYSDALTGLLQLSSQPMRLALTHMDAPE